MKNTAQKYINSNFKPEPPKKSALDKVKSVTFRTCLYFTCIVLFLLAAQASATADSVAKYVEPSRFLMIFPFALTVSLADMVWGAKNAKTALKLIVHYVVVTVAFYVFLYLPVQSTQNPTSPIIIIALLSVIYFICASIILVIISKAKKKKEAETPYVPVYSSVRTSKSSKN